MRRTGLVVLFGMLLFLVGCTTADRPVEFRLLLSSELNNRLGACG